MKFRLRSLLIVVTIAAVALATWIWMEQRRRHREARRDSFRELHMDVKALDTEIRAQLLAIPEVMAELQALRPIDPKGVVNEHITGQSMFVEQYQFSREMHFDWQRADGNYAPGSKHRFSAQLDENSSTPHVVELSYPPSPINRVIADWIEETLEKKGVAEVARKEDSP